MIRPEWTALEANVRIGAEWLLSSKQRKDAVGDHHGEGTHVGGGLRITFGAHGYVGAPEGQKDRAGVVVVELLRSTEQYLADVPEPPPFTDDEIDSIRALLTENGLDVVDEWNGAGLRTGSFGIRGVSPSLARTVDNYLGSCPKHDTVFCGGWQAEATCPPGTTAERESYLKCTWHSGGRARMVLPQFVHVEFDAPSAPSTPSHDDHNLRAVKEALAQITPVLVELGIHAATIVAGARGHIEGDERLEFVHDGGHGVNLPAEAAVTLVRAAWAAIEAGVVEAPNERGNE